MAHAAENGNWEDMASLKVLSDEDLAYYYIANNLGYRSMLQNILSPIIWEPSSKDSSADNSASSNSKGRGTDNTHSNQGR